MEVGWYGRQELVQNHNSIKSLCRGWTNLFTFPPRQICTRSLIRQEDACQMDYHLCNVIRPFTLHFTSSANTVKMYFEFHKQYCVILRPRFILWCVCAYVCRDSHIFELFSN